MLWRFDCNDDDSDDDCDIIVLTGGIKRNSGNKIELYKLCVTGCRKIYCHGEICRNGAGKSAGFTITTSFDSMVSSTMDVLDEGDSSSSSSESVSSEESVTPSYSSSDPSSSQNLQKKDSVKVSLSHHETKAVNRSKILVYISLVLCAVVTGTTTYFIAHQAEVHNYENAVRNDLFWVQGVSVAGSNSLITPTTV